jgi:hypothetical protein
MGGEGYHGFDEYLGYLPTPKGFWDLKGLVSLWQQSEISNYKCFINHLNFRV